MALLAFLGLLTFVFGTNAACTTTPTFAGTTLTLKSCRTLTTVSSDITSTANFAWNATATTITAVVSCSGLVSGGYCAFGFSPTGKMAAGNAVVGFPNPANSAQAKVLLYSLGNHKNVKPVSNNVGSLIRLTAKAVQVVSPSSVSIKFTARAKPGVNFKSIRQIWCFGRPALNFAAATLGGHPKGSHGVSKVNLVNK